MPKQTPTYSNEVNFDFGLSAVQAGAGQAMIDQEKSARGIILHMNAGSGKTCTAANIMDTWLGQGNDYDALFVTTQTLKDNNQCLLDIADNLCMSHARQHVKDNGATVGKAYNNIRAELRRLRNLTGDARYLQIVGKEIEKLISGADPSKKNDTLVKILKNVHSNFAKNRFVSHQEFWEYIENGKFGSNGPAIGKQAKRNNYLYIIDEAHLLPSLGGDVWSILKNHLTQHAGYKIVFMTATPGASLLDMCDTLNTTSGDIKQDFGHDAMIKAGKLNTVAIKRAMEVMRHKIVYEDSRGSNEYAQKVLTFIEVGDLMGHHIDLATDMFSQTKQTKNDLYKIVSKVHIWNDLYPENDEKQKWNPSVAPSQQVALYNRVCKLHRLKEKSVATNSNDNKNHILKTEKDIRRSLGSFYTHYFINKFADAGKLGQIELELSIMKEKKRKIQKKYEDANISELQWGQVVHQVSASQGSWNTPDYDPYVKKYVLGRVERREVLTPDIEKLSDSAKEYILDPDNTSVLINFMQCILLPIPGKGIDFINNLRSSTPSQKLGYYRGKYGALLSDKHLATLATQIIRVLHSNNLIQINSQNKLQLGRELEALGAKIQQKNELLKTISRVRDQRVRHTDLDSDEIAKIIGLLHIDIGTINTTLFCEPLNFEGTDYNAVDESDSSDYSKWHTKASFVDSVMNEPHGLISFDTGNPPLTIEEVLDDTGNANRIESYLLAYSPLAWKLWQTIKSMTSNDRHVIYCTSSDAMYLLHKLMENLSKPSVFNVVHTTDPASFKNVACGCLYICDKAKEGLNVFNASTMHIMNPMPRDDLEQVTSRCVRRGKSAKLVHHSVHCGSVNTSMQFPLLKVRIYDLLHVVESVTSDLTKMLLLTTQYEQHISRQQDIVMAQTILTQMSRDVAILRDNTDEKFGFNWQGRLLVDKERKVDLLNHIRNGDYLKHLNTLVSVRVGERDVYQEIKILKSDIIFAEVIANECRVIFKQCDLAEMVSRILDIDGANSITNRSKYWYDWSACDMLQEDKFSNDGFTGYSNTKIVQGCERRSLIETLNYLNAQFCKNEPKMRTKSTKVADNSDVSQCTITGGRQEHCVLRIGDYIYELYMGLKPSGNEHGTNAVKVLLPYNGALPGQELCTGLHLRIHKRIVFLNMIQRIVTSDRISEQTLMGMIQCIHAQSKVPKQSNIMWNNIRTTLEGPSRGKW
jgi:hypothetical protein